MQQYRKNLGKVSLTAEGIWNIKSKYDVLSIVYDEHTQHGFISKQPVPIGVDLYNSKYWMPLNVSGYVDSNIIILNKKSSDSSIETYTLEEAVKSIASVGRKPGCILGFYNSNVNRLDIGGRWEIWQFNSITISEWEDLSNWQNIYYNYNQFVGWYRNEEQLKINNPYPEIGCYAYVGNVLNEAVVYRCEIKHKWTETIQHAWDYIKVMIDGTVTVGENGNWHNNGEDTGIPANVKGDPGISPFIRYNTIKNKLEYSYDKNVWYECSDYISTWFRWNATSGDTQANNVGRIQISRDKVNWTNLSGDIINNLHISRYIGVDETLPTSGIAEGTIYAKGPYYAEGDTLNNNPIYRLWVYGWKGDTLAWQDNGEFTSIAAGVVQETGDSETEVMSQKAVTEKLSKLGSEIGSINKDMFEIGSVSISSDGWIYTDNVKRIRVKESLSIHFKVGDKISVNGDSAFYIGWKTHSGEYKTAGSWLSSYTIVEEAEYTMVVRTSSDDYAIKNVSALFDLLELKSAPQSELSFDEFFSSNDIDNIKTAGIYRRKIGEGTPIILIVRAVGDNISQFRITYSDSGFWTSSRKYENNNWTDWKFLSCFTDQGDFDKFIEDGIYRQDGTPYIMYSRSTDGIIYQLRFTMKEGIPYWYNRQSSDGGKTWTSFEPIQTLDVSDAVQVNNGLVQTSASDAELAYDKRYGLVFLTYMSARGLYGEQGGKISVSYFPTNQPTNSRTILITKSTRVYEPNIVSIGDGIVRVFYRKSDNSYWYKDLTISVDDDDNIVETLTKENEVKFNGVQFNRESLQNYLVGKGYTHEIPSVNATIISGRIRRYGTKIYTTFCAAKSNPVLVESSDNGATWEPFAISPYMCSYEFEYVILDGVIHAVYRIDDFAVTNAIRYISSSNNGETWSQPVELTNSTQTRPSILVYDNQILIQFNEFDNNTKDFTEISRGRTKVKLICGSSSNPNDWKVVASLQSKYGMVYPCVFAINKDIYMSFSDSQQSLQNKNTGELEQGKESLRWIKLKKL